MERECSCGFWLFNLCQFSESFTRLGDFRGIKASLTQNNCTHLDFLSGCDNSVILKPLLRIREMSRVAAMILVTLEDLQCLGIFL